MIKLKSISDDDKNAFLGNTLSRLVNALSAIKAYVTTHRLVGHPLEKLIDYIEKHSSSLEEGAKKLILASRAEMKNIISEVGVIPTPNRLKKEEKIDEANLVTSLLKVYTDFSDSDLGYVWGERLGVKTCPYCNRSYIFTVTSNHKKRPEYDHYYPKSSYPYLCASIYNIVPCCKICNSAKSKADPFDPDHGIIYPFTEEFGYDINFVVEYKEVMGLLDGKISISIKPNAHGYSLFSRIQDGISRFSLEDLYNSHADYASDLIRLLHIYTPSFVQSLMQTYPEILRGGVEDVKNLLFITYLEKEQWGERVLAKFTHDVVNQFYDFF